MLLNFVLKDTGYLKVNSKECRDNIGLANIGAIKEYCTDTVPANNNAIANPLVPGHTVWEDLGYVL
ncbi:hypothetical protein RhiirA1_450068 [Rhizophagus irregularis]|uniref:Uncharacterized protein n=1 Tax=Rhizophagus irregularis TaxID=588596 RepID=A0A2N0SFQ7_9GLOM|nr:hypothetical protein RhiirA1_450068 [Rhizophagus irregularis]